MEDLSRMATPFIKILVCCSQVFFICVSYASSQDLKNPKTVECTGNTIIQVGDRIGTQTPFSAIFRIEGDVVTMVEGDAIRFSKSYKASQNFTKQEPDTLGYASEKGNLFFFKTSGRFEIIKVGVVYAGLKIEKTSGQCKLFSPSNIFK
jgi:hypothetical protein